MLKCNGFPFLPSSQILKVIIFWSRVLKLNVNYGLNPSLPTCLSNQKKKKKPTIFIEKDEKVKYIGQCLYKYIIY